MGTAYTIILDIAPHPRPCFYSSPQRNKPILSTGLAKMFICFLVTPYRCCTIWTGLNICGRKWPFLSYFSHHENEAQVLQTLLVWHCLTSLCSISTLFLHLPKNYSGDFSMTLECDLTSGGPSFVARYMMHAPGGPWPSTLARLLSVLHSQGLLGVLQAPGWGTDGNVVTNLTDNLLIIRITNYEEYFNPRNNWRKKEEGTVR